MDSKLNDKNLDKIMLETFSSDKSQDLLQVKTEEDVQAIAKLKEVVAELKLTYKHTKYK